MGMKFVAVARKVFLITFMSNHHEYRILKLGWLGHLHVYCATEDVYELNARERLDDSMNESSGKQE